MAKIFKVSGYFVDANGDYDKDTLEVELENSVDAHTQHLKVEEVDIGEWEDENPLNYTNCDISECEKYFISNKVGGEENTDGGDR